MKVKEAIEILMSKNPEAILTIYDSEYNANEVTEIRDQPYNTFSNEQKMKCPHCLNVRYHSDPISVPGVHLS